MSFYFTTEKTTYFNSSGPAIGCTFHIVSHFRHITRCKQGVLVFYSVCLLILEAGFFGLEFEKKKYSIDNSGARVYDILYWLNDPWCFEEFVAFISKAEDLQAEHLFEGTAAAHLLRSWVRIPPGAWIFVCCECRVSLRRADHSSRGVLPTVLRRCV